MPSLIWAHRGANRSAPENTLPAFEQAIRQGADGIEIDVQRTSDGQLVVVHDEQLLRLTGQSGWVHQMTLEQLRQRNFAFHYGNYLVTPVPLLKEVLDLLKSTNLTLNIELKNGVVLTPDLEQQVMDQVRDFAMADRVIYSSFNHYSMRLIRQLQPGAACGLLYECGLVDPWIYANRVGATAIHPYFGSLQIPGLITDCRKAGIDVNVWTVDDPDIIRRCAQLEVHAIITNVPDLARKIISPL